MRTLASIWRAMTSMCLSFICTPWEQYTFCTSSTKYRWTASFPKILRISCGLIEPSVSCCPAFTVSPSCTLIWTAAETAYSRSSVSLYLIESCLSEIVTSPATRARIGWLSVRAADDDKVFFFLFVFFSGVGLASTVPISTHWPFSTITSHLGSSAYSSWKTSIAVTLIHLPSLLSTTSTTPFISDIIDWALGGLASKSSSTLGKPLVISSPTTPPVWKVRSVSWVPGSPILWAAIIPTAVLMSTRWPRARSRP